MSRFRKRRRRIAALALLPVTAILDDIPLGEATVDTMP